MMLAFRRFSLLLLIVAIFGATAFALAPQNIGETSESQPATTTEQTTSTVTAPADSGWQPLPDLKGQACLAVAYLIPLLGVAGLIFTFWKSSWVAKQEVGTDRMMGIAKNITEERPCRS